MRYKPDTGEEIQIVAASSAKGMRLDMFLANHFPEPSRTFIQRLIKDGLLTITPGRAKSSHKLQGGELITLKIPEPVELSAEPENIPLNIIYEDEHIIVINKPHKLVVHPSPGHETGTLVNALLYHCNDLSGIGGVLRPGIVHRLDQDTSGCLVAAKSDKAHQHLTNQFAKRTVTKIYHAITNGIPKVSEGDIQGLIGRNQRDPQKMTLGVQDGKDSFTRYKVLETFRSNALIECSLYTGRTHQIRVHLKSIGCPILCDAVYGNAQPVEHDGNTILDRQALHALKLEFDHPIHSNRMYFNAELPADMQNTLCLLRNSKLS